MSNYSNWNCLDLIDALSLSLEGIQRRYKGNPKLPLPLTKHFVGVFKLVDEAHKPAEDNQELCCHSDNAKRVFPP